MGGMALEQTKEIHPGFAGQSPFLLFLWHAMCCDLLRLTRRVGHKKAGDSFIYARSEKLKSERESGTKLEKVSPSLPG